MKIELVMIDNGARLLILHKDEIISEMWDHTGPRVSEDGDYLLPLDWEEAIAKALIGD